MARGRMGIFVRPAHACAAGGWNLESGRLSTRKNIQIPFVRSRILCERAPALVCADGADDSGLVIILVQQAEGLGYTVAYFVDSAYKTTDV